MDTNQNVHDMGRRSFFRYLKLFVIILSIFVVIECFAALKGYGSIGQGPNGPATITVSGTGTITASPDIADISFTVSKDGATATAAQNSVSTIVTPALAAVSAEGVASTDVQTGSYNLNPKYASNTVVCMVYPCPQPPQKIVGYTVSETVDIKVRNLDTVSDLLTKLAAAGVSNITGPNFVIDNPTTLQNQAEAKAIIDAHTEAVALAKELDVHLGSVMSFSDSGSPIMYPRVMSVASEAVAAAPTVQVPTGQNTITSNVSVTYAIN